LLAVAMLGQTDETRFAGGWPIRQRQQATSVYALRFQQRPDAMAGVVESNHAAADDVHAQFAEVGGHTARAANTILFITFSQDRHRRLGADPIGVTVHVTVQDEIADEQYSLAAE